MSIIDIERPEAHEDHAPAIATEPPAPSRAVATPAPPQVSEPTPTAPRRRLFADLAGPLSRNWGIVLMVAWVVVVAVGLAIEPAPANPDAPIPLYADLISTGMLAAWGAMAAGVFQRRRFAAAASMVGGVALLGLTLACPLTGHHSSIGAWWGIQLVGAAGLLALSGRALRSS
jgi:peptidoglycan/LPS O-acetylase OafA/YrhL